MYFKTAVNALILTCCFAAGSSHASVAQVVLDGTAGDYITGGHTVDNIYSSTNPSLIWDWATFQNVGTNATPEADNVSFTFLLNSMSNDEYATLIFSTQGLGKAMAMGTYFNAERAPFAPAGDPGLEINYDHRGCNNLVGHFTINQLTFANDAIDQFSASFTQSCDGGALMSGTINYDADETAFSSAVPEPASTALVGLGILVLGFAHRRKRANSAF